MAAGHATTARLGGRFQQFSLIIAAQTLHVGRHLLRTQLAHQMPCFVEQAWFGAKQQQFVGPKVDGGTGRNVFAGEVEDFASRRIPQRRQQHDGTFVEQAVDALAVHPPHFAGVVVVHAIEHANRTRRHQIAARHPQARTLHRRGRHVHRQPGFYRNAQLTDGVDHTFQRRGVGDAHAFVVMRRQPAGLQAAFDLRARAMHQHQPNAQTVQQHQVVNDVAEIGVRHAVAGKHDDEGAIAVGIDVRGRVT